MEYDEKFIKEFAKKSAESVSHFYQCARHFRPTYERVNRALGDSRYEKTNSFGFTLYALGLHPLEVFPVRFDTFDKILSRCTSYPEEEVQGGIVTFRDIFDHELAYSALFTREKRIKPYSRSLVKLTHVSDERQSTFYLDALPDFLQKQENQDLDPESLEFFVADRKKFLMPFSLVCPTRKS